MIHIYYVYINTVPHTFSRNIYAITDPKLYQYVAEIDIEGNK